MVLVCVLDVHDITITGHTANNPLANWDSDHLLVFALANRSPQLTLGFVHHEQGCAVRTKQVAGLFEHSINEFGKRNLS